MEPLNDKKTDHKQEVKMVGANRIRTLKIAQTAILSAIAIVLMFFEIAGIPFMPPFLKLDFSDIPALIASFALGPVSGIIVQLIKNIAHLPTSSSAYVGELANFIAGSLFAGTAGLIYKRSKTTKGVIWGLTIGTISMTIFTSLFNYFFMIDFYARLFGTTVDEIVAMTTAVNPLVTDLKTLIVFAFVPFNLIKGIIISIITVLLYQKISPILLKRQKG